MEFGNIQGNRTSGVNCPMTVRAQWDQITRRIIWARFRKICEGFKMMHFHYPDPSTVNLARIDAASSAFVAM
jgi:hypothetical protein